MPRKQLIRSATFPYHVTARTNNKEPFPISHEHMWQINCYWFRRTMELYPFKPLAFVQMSNHFHFLIQTPHLNIDQIMQYFLGHSSKSIMARAGKINRVYGGRYKWSLITEPNYYANAYKYVLRNPIEAGLSDTVQQYPWSSFYHKHRLQNKFLKLGTCDLDCYIPAARSEQLAWLNAKFGQEQYTAIQIGLQKKVFKFPKGLKMKREVYFDAGLNKKGSDP